MSGSMDDYWRDSRLWRESLQQPTYTVAEAAVAMKMSEKKVRLLIKDGLLRATRASDRKTIITREAIVDYMAPSPLRKFLG